MNQKYEAKLQSLKTQNFTNGIVFLQSFDYNLSYNFMVKQSLNSIIIVTHVYLSKILFSKLSKVNLLLMKWGIIA